MRSRSVPASLAERFYPRLAGALALVILLGICALAQQPTERKRTPRMTSDDLTQPGPPASAEGSDASAADAKADAAKVEGGKGEKKKPVSDDEEGWRERVRLAREKAKELERSRDEAELRVTNLRNDLGVSGRDSQTRNQIASEIETAGQELNDLRKKARDAQADLKDLLDYGREKGFSEAEGPKATNEEGKANESYYRAKFAELSEEIQTADRQVQVYENRVRDIQQRILNTSGTGDNFTLSQLQQDKADAQRSLEDAQTTKTRASEKRDALVEEARRAGLPPGTFR